MLMLTLLRRNFALNPLYEVSEISPTIHFDE